MLSYCFIACRFIVLDFGRALDFAPLGSVCMYVCMYVCTANVNVDVDVNVMQCNIM